MNKFVDMIRTAAARETLGEMVRNLQTIHAQLRLSERQPYPGAPRRSQTPTEYAAFQILRAQNHIVRQRAEGELRALVAGQSPGPDQDAAFEDHLRDAVSRDLFEDHLRDAVSRDLFEDHLRDAVSRDLIEIAAGLKRGDTE